MHKSELMFLHKIKEKETTLMSEQKVKLDQSMEAPIFNIKSLKCALETIEDLAHADELSYKEKNIPVKITPVYTENVEPFYQESIASQLSDHCNQSLYKVEQKLEDERLVMLYRKQKEYEDHKMLQMENCRKKTDGIKLKRKLIKEKEKKRLEKINDQNEKEMQKLLEQQLKEQKSMKEQIKNRKQEAEKRKRKKEIESLEKKRKAEMIYKQSFELVQTLNDLSKDPRYSCLTKDDSIITSEDEVDKLLQNLKLIAFSNQVIDLSQLQSMKNQQEKLEKTVITCRNNYESARSLKIQEDLKKQKEENEKALAEEERKKKEAIAEDNKKKLEIKTLESYLPSVPEIYESCISRGAYQEYVKFSVGFNLWLNLMNEVKEKKKINATYKTFLSQTTRIVSQAANSFTNRAGSDIISVVDDLLNMLKGKKMKVPGQNKYLCVTSIENGQKVAKYIIAQKFAEQCEKVVTPFPLAFTVILMWSQDEEFGHLFMCHMRKRCPYIYPMYIPMKDISVAEYKTLIGAKEKESGLVEDDVYVKRMCCYIKVYAAITQSVPPPKSKRNPHAIKNAWIWLTRIVNLPPRDNLTASMLLEFLKVAGNVCFSTYKLQFIKLLKLLINYYIPKIKEVSKEDVTSLSRLQQFLEKCIKSQNVELPSDHIGESFWKSVERKDLVGG